MNDDLQIKLREAMDYAVASNDWAESEGNRIVLELEWHLQYEKAPRFLKWLMRHTTPKSLFVSLKSPHELHIK